ncbi:MAG: hypothetical protein VYC34_09215 [Planctomycetota bacterium]|nr:hypothetical protein [Planctomycetota bacterium]
MSDGDAATGNDRGRTEIRRIVYFGADESDRMLFEELLRVSGLPGTLVPAAGVYGSFSRLPKRLRTTPVWKMAHATSPWADALRLGFISKRGDLVLMKNLRSAIAYLWIVRQFTLSRPRTAITWFAPSARPGKRNTKIYRKALRRASDLFVYTERDADELSTQFETPRDRFALMRLHANSFDPPRRDHEFDVAMGGMTTRDWELLGEVARRLPHRRFLAIPPVRDRRRAPKLSNVTIRTELSPEMYRKAYGSARVVALLLRDRGVASGHRDIVTTAQAGAALVVTGIEGVDLYVRADEHARVIPEGDVDAAVEAIESLLVDDQRRRALAASLAGHIQSVCSPTAIAELWRRRLFGSAGETETRIDSSQHRPAPREAMQS